MFLASAFGQFYCSAGGANAVKYLEPNMDAFVLQSSDRFTYLGQSPNRIYWVVRDDRGSRFHIEPRNLRECGGSSQQQQQPTVPRTSSTTRWIVNGQEWTGPLNANGEPDLTGGSRSSQGGLSVPNQGQGGLSVPNQGQGGFFDQASGGEEFIPTGRSSGSGKWSSDEDWNDVTACAGRSFEGTDLLANYILGSFQGGTRMGRTYGCTYMNPTRPASPPYTAGRLSDHASGYVLKTLSQFFSQMNV